MAESIVLERFPVTRRTTTHPALTRRRVYILPTRYGLLFGVMIVVMLIGGINYNNSMAYVLTFILSSMVMVGILHTYRNLAGLVLTAAPPEPVFCEQTAVFPILIDNRNSEQRYAIEFQIRRRRSRFKPAEVIAGRNIDIPAGALHTVGVPLRMQRRGRIACDRVTISSAFPLGLFRAWAYFDHDRPCVVYPKPLGNQPLPEPVLVDHHELTGSRSGTDDFVGFRAYRPGDASNSISWKHYARERDLQVKRFQGQGSMKLILTLQQADIPGTIERRLGQLCQWLLSAEQQGLMYGLDLGGVKLPADNDRRHLNRCLEALTDYGEPRP